MMKITLRRLRHRGESEQKIADRWTMNTTFTTDYGPTKLILMPLPEFIENTCSFPNCNKIAMCMIAFSNQFRPVCENHLNQQFPPVKQIQEKVLVVPSVDQAVKGNAFEWQPQGKTEWYKVRGAGITWDSEIRLPIAEIKKRWDEIMYQVLCDSPQLVDAEYDKDNKKLIIFV